MSNALPWLIGGAALLWALKDDDVEGLEETAQPTKQGTTRRYLLATMAAFPGREFILGHVAPGESTDAMRLQMNQLMDAVGRAEIKIWRDFEAAADTSVRVILARHPTVTDGIWLVVVGHEDRDASESMLVSLKKSLPGFEFRTMDDYWPAAILHPLPAGVSGHEGKQARGFVTALTSVGV